MHTQGFALTPMMAHPTLTPFLSAATYSFPLHHLLPPPCGYFYSRALINSVTLGSLPYTQAPPRERKWPCPHESRVKVASHGVDLNSERARNACTHAHPRSLS